MLLWIGPLIFYVTLFTRSARNCQSKPAILPCVAHSCSLRKPGGKFRKSIFSRNSAKSLKRLLHSWWASMSRTRENTWLKPVMLAQGYPTYLLIHMLWVQFPQNFPKNIFLAHNFNSAVRDLRNQKWPRSSGEYLQNQKYIPHFSSDTQGIWRVPWLERNWSC
jgi:hypothetical protein